MEDCFESLAKVKVMPSTAVFRWASHTITKSNQVGEANFVFHKSMLAIPNQILVLHVPGHGF